MSPVAKNGVMLVVLVGALAAAGLFFTRSKKDRVYPDDPSLSTKWICTKCDKHIELTPAEYKEWIDSKDKIRRDPNYAGARVIVFWCPDCAEFSVVRAVIDRKDMTWYPQTDVAGRPWQPEDAAKKAGK
jgi:hypothetical protein